MGKTTFCYAIMGMIPIRSGAIVLDNVSLDRRSAMQVARRGIAIVPQGRRVFPSLSVDEHLKLASRGQKAAWTRSGSTTLSLDSRRGGRTAALNCRVESSRCLR
nr:ATP-binding cassette domain-containing protein [Nitrobacter vulgaris]